MKTKQLFPTIFLIIISFYFFSCSNKLEKIPSTYIKENQPDVTLINFYTKFNSNEQLRIEAEAPIAYFFLNIDNPYREFPDGLLVNIFDNNFNITSSVKSDYAIYYDKQKLGKASGNVVVKSENGGLLKTQELYIDQNTAKIYSIKYVEVLVKDGTIIRGKGGFESNLDFTIYEFKNVDGVIPALIKDEL